MGRGRKDEVQCTKDEKGRRCGMRNRGSSQLFVACLAATRRGARGNCGMRISGCGLRNQSRERQRPVTNHEPRKSSAAKRSQISASSMQPERKAGGCLNRRMVGAGVQAGPRACKPVFYRFGFPIPRLHAVNSHRTGALANGDDRVKMWSDIALQASRHCLWHRWHAEGRGFESLWLHEKRGPC